MNIFYFFNSILLVFVSSYLVSNSSSITYLFASYNCTNLIKSFLDIFKSSIMS